MDSIRSEKPKHDGYSHYRSALEYLALGLEDIKPENRRPYDKFKKRDLSGRLKHRKITGY